MPLRRDSSFSIALGLSLVVHGAFTVALVESYRPARGGGRYVSAVQEVGEAGVILVTPAVKRASTEELPKLVPAKPDELPPLPKEAERAKVKPERELPQLKSVFGEPGGDGDAPHSHEGEEPMRSPRVADQRQAPLTRDQVKPGKRENAARTTPGGASARATGARPAEARPAPVAPTPVMPAPLPVTAFLPAVKARALPEGVVKPEPRYRETTEEARKPDVMIGVPSESVTAVAPRVPRKVLPPLVEAIGIENPGAPKPVEGEEKGNDATKVEEVKERLAAQLPAVSKPLGVPEKEREGEKSLAIALPVPAPQPIAPTRQSSAPSQQVSASSASGSQSQSRPQREAGEDQPLTPSDSDSDPFSKVVSVDFRPGRVDAQFGRRIKTVRPKLLLGGQVDLFSQVNPKVLLSANVDATGHVTRVDVYKSSGFADLDQPCLVALYDWWFEPPKDKNGKPLPDVVVVSITFHTR